MKRPTTPKPINPPITPAISSSSGRSTPRLINTGFSTLSITVTNTVQTASVTPQPKLPVQNNQMTAGNSTNNGPSCATQSTNVIASSTPALPPGPCPTRSLYHVSKAWPAHGIATIQCGKGGRPLSSTLLTSSAPWTARSSSTATAMPNGTTNTAAITTVISTTAGARR